MAKPGVIYILTNPAFPEYIKIGYASDLESRLKTLNRSETIPFAFRVYAVYEVEGNLTDKELHKLIDALNPDLRTIETFDGKKRVKEFYAMSKEDGYQLLESIAKISGTLHRLKKMTPEGHEIKDETLAEENKEMARKGPFRFNKVGIPVGAELTYIDDPKIKVTVVDDKHILHDGKTTSMSRWVQDTKRLNHPVQGTQYFSYNGKKLVDLREEQDKKKK